MNTLSSIVYNNKESHKTLALALSYFSIYLFSLFFTLESEFWHWITLVLLPFSLIYFLHNSQSGTRDIRLTLKEFGLEKSKFWNGLLWAVVIGLVLSTLQFRLSRNNEEILSLFQSGQYLYLLPKAIFILFITAGFTEEFFFRGFLQTRFQNVFKSSFVSIQLTSLLFGLYHLPYAYLNPKWPSHGNLQEAITLAFSQGIPAGLILGAVYSRTGNNLFASVIVHVMINALPAMLVFNI
jgi:membrane protease YdiL (CAAX protease family)